MTLFQIFLMIPLGIIGLAASILIPMYLKNKLDNIVEAYVSDPEKVQKCKLYNENFIVVLYISFFIFGSLYIL